MSDAILKKELIYQDNRQHLGQMGNKKSILILSQYFLIF